MKRGLFQEIRTGRMAQCAIDNVVYPDALYGIMSFIEHTGMSVAMLRFGMDGIELATDPSFEAGYIEYNLYFDKARFEERRQEYLNYLNENLICCNTTDSKYAMDYELKNRHKVMLYENKDKGILIYKDVPRFLKVERNYYSTSNFLPMIHASMNGELTDSCFSEVGFPHSPLLPKRSKVKIEKPTLLRFDGLYVLNFENESGKNLSSFLRFFPTGMMAGCLADSTAIGEAFMRLDEETPCFGSYFTKENKIVMHITGIGFDETKLIGTIHDGYLCIEDEPTFVNQSIWNKRVHHEMFVFHQMDE